METVKSRTQAGLTLIEVLAVFAIIGVLAVLLLPVFSTAREKANRVSCANNLKQIGNAIMLYADDYQDHVPPVYPRLDGPGNYTHWAQTLVNLRYATPKIFVCPDDIFSSGQRSTAGSLSYALNIANSRLSDTDPTQSDYWIAGSRMSCSHLHASEVALVTEYYSEMILPTMRSPDNWSYVTGPKTLLTAADGNNHPPVSKHEHGVPMSGNYLFMDGRVEWVDHPEYRREMFPKVPLTAGVGPYGRLCP